MKITIGSFSFIIDRIGLVLRVPLLGQVVWSRGVGLYWDSWRTLKATW